MTCMCLNMGMHWQLVENEMYRESLGPSLSTSPARVLPCRPLRLPLLSASCRMRRFLTAREKASSLSLRSSNQKPRGRASKRPRASDDNSDSQGGQGREQRRRGSGDTRQT